MSVLIDTPPGGSLISIQAAKATYHALLVTQAQRFRVEAIPDTLLLVQEVRDSYQHEDLDVLGLAFNEYTERSQIQGQLMAQVEQAQSMQTQTSTSRCGRATQPARFARPPKLLHCSCLQASAIPKQTS